MERRTLLRGLATAAALPTLEGLTPHELLAVRRRVVPGDFRVLSPHQAALVAEMAEIIIPETDTPGAREAGVAEFIDLMLAEQVDPPACLAFLKGVDGCDAIARERFGNVFLECAPAERYALVAGLDEELQARRQSGGPTGDLFFQRMKGWTVAGYYTSRVGATSELRSPIIPGRWDGCVPLPVPPAGAPS